MSEDKLMTIGRSCNEYDGSWPYNWHVVLAMAVREEREACAQICDDIARRWAEKAALDSTGDEDCIDFKSTAWGFSVAAETIRARGDK